MQFFFEISGGMGRMRTSSEVSNIRPLAEETEVLIGVSFRAVGLSAHQNEQCKRLPLVTWL